MAQTTDTIIIEYKAQIDGFKAQLTEATNKIKSVEDASKKASDNTKKEFQKTGNSVKEALGEIAKAIGIAFGVEKIISFGKESIKAFIEAEENAKKLSFAVQRIGNEGEKAFKKLIDQSNKFQQISIFSDDDIQRAQTQLIQFGLTSNQVEKLVPQILDLASAQGDDLSTATDKVIQGLNGQTRGLKSAGIQFADTGSKTENLAILTEKLTKFQGASADALETTSGKLSRLNNIFDDLKETIGEFLVNQANNLVDAFDLISGSLSVSDIAFRESAKERANFVSKFSSLTAQERADTLKSLNTQIEVFSKQKTLTENQLLAYRIAIATRSQLLKEINAEENKSAKIRDDLTVSGLAKQEEAIRKLKELKDKEQKEHEDRLKHAAEVESKALDDLIAFEIKTEEDLSKELAANQEATIENDRRLRLQEAEQKYQDAIQSGVEAATAKTIELQAIENINKEFDDKQKDLNQQQFDEAIKEAEEFEDAKAKIEQDANKKRLEEQKRIQNEFVDFIQSSLNSISEINSNLIQQRLQEVQESSDAEISSLDNQYNNQLISREEYEQKKSSIDKRVKEEERRLKKQEFESNKQTQIINTIIATARAVAEALPNLVLAGIAGAAGLAQLAIIQSQPTPKFEKGGKIKGKRHSRGGTLVEAEEGEWIIKREQSINNDKLLRAINEGEAQRFILQHYIAPALKAQQKKHAESKNISFADNIAKSMMLNTSDFKDGNLLDSLKRSRKADRENTLYLAKIIAANNNNQRVW